MILLSYKTLVLSIGFVHVLMRLCGLVNFMSEELCLRLFQEADESQFPDGGDDVGHSTSFRSAHVVYENIFETFHGAGYGERQTGGTVVRGIRSLVVDKSGAGNYRTVQEAVDAVSVFNTQRVLIQIREGTFL
jgi:hypothetical protein